MPPRRRVRSSERDAMCRPPVAQADILSRRVRTQSTRRAHTVEARAHTRTHNMLDLSRTDPKGNHMPEASAETLENYETGCTGSSPMR